MTSEQHHELLLMQMRTEAFQQRLAILSKDLKVNPSVETYSTLAKVHIQSQDYAKQITPRLKELEELVNQERWENEVDNILIEKDIALPI